MISIKIKVDLKNLYLKFGIKKTEKLNKIIERMQIMIFQENLYVKLIVKKINMESVEHINKYKAIFLFGSLALTSGKSAETFETFDNSFNIS